MSPPTDDQKEGEYRFVSWNAKVNRDVDQVMDDLHRLIEDWDPQVICLQEFYQYLSAAKKRYGKDGTGNWYVYGHSDWQYSGNSPIMVRAATHNRQERGKGWDTIRYQTHWTGPKGKDFNGRTWTWVKTNSAYILSVHRCTGGNGPNKEAFADEYDLLLKWARNHDDLPVVILGDHNCSQGDDFPNSSKRLAEAIGGGITGPKSGVDFAVRKSFTGSSKDTPKYGSDHEGVFILRD